MLTAQHILALMLMLIPPGKSIYSQTQVEQGSPPACDAPSIMCREPRYSARRGGWFRPETYDEGLARYWTIAQSLHASTGGKPHLTRLSLSVIFEESGFRKDVHDGVSISDGYRKDDQGHDHPIETGRGDLGKSWCIGQFNLGRGSKIGPTLVGTSPEATSRCTDKIAKELARGWHFCKRWGKADEQCVFAAYGGRISLRDTKPIRRRAATYWRLKTAAERRLSDEVIEKLGLREEQDDGTQDLKAASAAVE